MARRQIGADGNGVALFDYDCDYVYDIRVMAMKTNKRFLLRLGQDNHQHIEACEIVEMAPSGEYVNVQYGPYHAQWMTRQEFMDAMIEEVPDPQFDNNGEWIHPDWDI